MKKNKTEDKKQKTIFVKKIKTIKPDKFFFLYQKMAKVLKKLN